MESGEILARLEAIASEQQRVRRTVESMDTRNREAIDNLAKTISRRETQEAYKAGLLREQVDRLSEDVRGKDGEGGLCKDVEEIKQRINFGLGIMAAITTLGALVGWCFNQIASLWKSH